MGFAKIRPKRGTKAQWEQANTVLSEGEWGVEYSTAGIGQGPVNIKIGDGSTAWGDLEYAITGSSIANNLTTTEEGFALDARQGKTLNDNLTQSLSGCRFVSGTKILKGTGSTSLTLLTLTEVNSKFGLSGIEASHFSATVCNGDLNAYTQHIDSCGWKGSSLLVTCPSTTTFPNNTSIRVNYILAYMP